MIPPTELPERAAEDGEAAPLLSGESTSILSAQGAQRVAFDVTGVTPSQDSPNVLAQAQRMLYCSHALSAWGARMWVRPHASSLCQGVGNVVIRGHEPIAA